MKWFYKMENKLSKYAIHGLMRYFVALYAIGFVISISNVGIYYEYLALDIQYVLAGQLWRIVTWLVYPPSTSIIFGAIMLWVEYSIGTSLERWWGSFRFNVFMLMSVVFHIIAAIILYNVDMNSGIAKYITPTSINMSLFLAFAATFPDAEFYLYFAIPIKAKYLAIFYVIIEAYAFITGSTIEKITIILSFLSVIIFFAVTRKPGLTRVKQMKKRTEFRNKVKMQTISSMHKCAICGRTEKDSDNLEFRYCSKCNGSYEYCSEHLYTHEHIK